MISLDEIVKGCKQYNKTSQRLLYEKYAPLMKGVCIRYLNNTSDLEDIMHDGFIKVFMKIGQFSAKGSFEGWMKRIFINTAIKHNTKHKQKIHVDVDNLPTDTSKDNLIFNDNDGSAEDGTSEIPSNQYEAVLMADFSEEEMLEAIKSLPEKLRTVFNLYCIEDFSHEEIGDLLNIDITTSRTRLLRARNYIKKELYNLSLARIKK